MLKTAVDGVKLLILRMLESLGCRLVKLPYRKGPATDDPRKKEELDLEFRHYVEIFGQQAVNTRSFLNIGAGGFRHRFGKNVDYYSDWYKRYDWDKNVDIERDISLLQPLDVADDSIALVYTGHTIEHLLERHVEHLFREAHRILIPEGLVCVVFPDMDLYSRAYKLKRMPNSFLYRQKHRENVCSSRCCSCRWPHNFPPGTDSIRHR